MKLWIYVLIGLILTSIGIVGLTRLRSQKANDVDQTALHQVSMYIEPPMVKVKPGGSFSIQVMLNPADEKVSSLSFKLLYDGEFLNKPTVSVNKVFADQLEFRNEVEEGSVRVALLRNIGSPFYSGDKAVVATINFESKVKARGESGLGFAEDETRVFNLDTNDVLDQDKGGKILFI